MNLLVSVRSEILKLKRTLTIYLCILAAAFGPLMSFMENLDDLATEPRRNIAWTVHFLEGRDPVNIALLPFYVILICALMLQIEYRDKTWKQVLTSPQPLVHIFLAKFITLHIMIFAFLICFNLFLALSGIGTEMMLPTLYEGKLDVFRLISVNAQLWFLIMGLSAIQFWLSLRFRNFVAPLAIGVAMWFVAPMMLFQFETTAVEFFPYAFSMLAIVPKFAGNVVTYQWYSIVTALLFLFIAFLEFRKMRVKN